MRAPRVLPLACALALAVGSAACLGPSGAPASALRGGSPVDPTYEAAFAALAEALEAGDDAVAQAILDRILARAPQGAALALARSYERVLRGRELARSLELVLECEPADAPLGVPAGAIREGEGSAWRLFLSARHALSGPFELSTGPGRLGLTVRGIDEAATEQAWGRSHPLAPIERLTLAAGAPARVELGTFELPLGRSLAARGTWRLALPAATLRAGGGGAELPAKDLAVRPCSAERTAAHLPREKVEPQELARFLRQANASSAALVERTVRIDPARRGEALDLLAAQALASDRLVFAARYAPALRWLAGERDLGVDLETWRPWLERRLAGDGEAPPDLVLPDRPPREEAPQ